MSFISINFFIFYIIFLVFLKIPEFLKNEKISNLLSKTILLLGNFTFLLLTNVKCFICVFIQIILVYFFSILCEGKYRLRKIAVTVGVIIQICILCYFKYMNFFLDSISAIFNISINRIDIIIPLGISFYTFTSISYLVDIYKNKISCNKNFLDCAIFISFFPKLASGPIVKAQMFFPQLEKRTLSIDNIRSGLQVFLFGLAKKVVLADRLAIFVDDVYAAPAMFSSGTVLLALISYSLQIYLDFSGYSDMAIGVSKTLGFEFERNFNIPYLSQNVTEFWKRWHISLSNWLMEYIYFPLGGNRKGAIRTYINLMITMLIGGLWHGANWTFIIWGGLHGLALCIHKIYSKFNKVKKNIVTKSISIIFTFLFVSFCWIFFRADSIENAICVLKVVVSSNMGIKHYYLWSFISFAVVLIAYIITIKYKSNEPLPKALNKTNCSHVMGYYPISKLDNFYQLFLQILFIGLILTFAYISSNPFIYGNF